MVKRVFPTTRPAFRYLWIMVLCFPLAYLPGCGPADGGNGNDNQNQNGNTNGNANDNSSNGNTNDNGDGPVGSASQMEFDLEGGALEPFARALSADDTQFAFFGDTATGEVPTSLTQVDAILPSSQSGSAVAVRLFLDQIDRPVSFLSEDESVLLLSFSTDGTTAVVRFVDPSGRTTRDEVVIDATATAAQAASDDEIVCDALARFRSIMGSVLASCDGSSGSALCVGSIARAVTALNDFCAAPIEIVSNTLPAGLGEGPPLSVPLGVTVVVDDDKVVPGTNLAMTGSAFGGVPPYIFNWSVAQGPAFPNIIPTSSGSFSFASVNLAIEGQYVIRLTVIGDDSDISLFDLRISVESAAGELSVIATAEVSDTSTFEYDLSAEASGGEPPYEYTWSMIAGPEAATVEFDPASGSGSDAFDSAATFSAGGTYILQMLVSDGAGASASTRPAVTVIDPATSLLIDIGFPPCASATNDDTCVDLNDSIALSVVTTNAEASTEQLQYTWTIEQPTGSIGVEITAAIDVTGDALGTITVMLSVTDPIKSETAMDEITIQVIPTGGLSVMIIGESSALVDVPLNLIANVSGAVGLLFYEWVATPACAECFDDPTAQSVDFTPSDLGNVTIEVTVTDIGGIDESATDTIMVSVATFTAEILGDGVITSNVSEFYSVSLSDSAPADVTYEWSVENADADDSLAVVFLNDSETASTAQILAVGDGDFTLSVAVEEVGNTSNSTGASLAVEATCFSGDEPTADAGTAQVVAAGGEVSLTCSADQTLNRSFRWRSLNSTIADEDLIDADAATATFSMPNTIPLGFDPLEFECIVSNTTTSCDESDTTLVYASPLVAPTAGSVEQTVLIGSVVSLTCQQSSGSTASMIDVRRITNFGVEIDPPDLEEFDVTGGVLSFIAPATPQQLFFECRGTVATVDGDIAGEFNAEDRATVNVVGFDVTAVARDGDDAPIGVPGVTFSQVTVDRVRLNNASTQGYLVFSSVLSAASTTGLFGVSLDDLATVELVVRQGDVSPAGGSLLVGRIGAFDLQDDNDVAFIAPITNLGAPTEDVMVIRLDSSSGVLSEVTGNDTDDLTPSGKRLCDFDDVAVAGDGTVTFIAQIDSDGDSSCADESTNADGVYTTSTTIAEAGVTTMPGTIPAATFGAEFSKLIGNDSGTVIFAGQDAASPTVSGAFVKPTGVAPLDSLFVSNTPAADTNGVYDIVDGGSADLAISSAGASAFQVDLDGLPLGDNSTQGIFTDEVAAGKDIIRNNNQSPSGFGFTAFKQVAVNAAGNMAFIATDTVDKLYYYVAALDRVVVVRDQNGVEVAEGNTIGGVLISGDGLDEADVQINNAGNIVFTANKATGTAAVFVAMPPN